MTMVPDNPERDPALSKAWREHSAEMPPGRLDAAIRAAARRAVGSAPRDTDTPEALRPQRWWMPLAAAAMIGAVALGVLQTMPADQPVSSPSVSDMPASAPVSPPATSPAPSAPDKLESTERKDAPRENADAVAAPEGALREKALDARRAQAEPTGQPSAVTEAPRSFTFKPATPPSAANAPMKQIPKIETQRAAGNAGAPVPAPDTAPQPFPAERKIQSSDAAFAKERGSVVAGVTTEPSAAPSSAAPPATAPVSEFQARPDAAAASQSRPAPRPYSSTPAPRASSPPPVAAPAAAAPEPARAAGARDEMRQRNEVAQSAPAATGAVTLSKKAATVERDSEVRDAVTRDAAMKDAGKPVDVDAWIARIRKLHDEGKFADAAKELNAMRAAHPDADTRLPPELRAWAASVKR